MTRPLVLLSRRIPPAGMHLLETAGVRTEIIEPDAEKIVDPAAILAAIGGADVLLCLLTEPIGEDILAAATHVRGIANMAVGYDNIAVSTATAMGIPVSNTPGVLTDTTADLTWALLLSAARRIVEGDAYMRGGHFRLWGPELMLGADVSPGGSGARKTLGIVGYGRIGRAVARRAAGFDMRVLAFSPGRTGVEPDGTSYVTLDELLMEADFVTIHAPANAATRGMIGEREFALMKPHTYLINVARGEIVDETALVRALRANTIAGAALDVFEAEPAMAEGLARCPNVVIVPHIGSASTDTRNRMAAMAATNAIAHLNGNRAPNVVNAGVYESDAYRARQQAPHGDSRA
ncbi:MAG: D-glycerate dehydrogenase [Longimicrobiales bacterium]